MKVIKNVLSEISNLKGAKFVGLQYRNKQNELSKYVVLVGISYENWVNKKIAALESLETTDLQSIALDKNISIDVVNEAKESLLSSLLKNKNEETASNQSKGQKDAYLPLESGARLHLESKNIQVYGLLVSKTVIEAGEPKKPVKSKDLTIAKKAIEKYLNFSAFVTFNIENEETIINITGNTFTNI